MPKLPPVKGKQLLKLLLQLGYVLNHVRGSHHIIRKPDGKKITVPIHGNSELPRGTLLGILDDAEISKEQLVAFLKK